MNQNRTKLHIIIDNREQKIKQKLTVDKYPCISYENLELGDILVKYDNELLLIIERKTLSDLASSVKDGRYKQQKIRLLNNFPKHKILYLIEGDLNKSKNDYIGGLKTYTLSCCLVNCILRDNINVYKTLNLQETIRFLKTIISKLKKQGISFLQKSLTVTDDNKQDVEKSYQNSIIKRSKKKNLTKKTCFIGQLCQIPKVSLKIATPIVENYKTLSNLIIEYNKHTIIEEKQNLLSEIKIPQKNGKLRRIGKKVSNTIYEFLFEEDIIES